MTAKTDGRLTAALLLTRQALALLEEISTPPQAPTPPAMRTRTLDPTRPARVLQTWYGEQVPLSTDEAAVLDVLDLNSDDDDIYRRGRKALEAECHLGRRRLELAVTALSSPLTGPDGTRPALVQVRPGARGRVDYRLLIRDTDPVDTGPQTLDLRDPATQS